MLGAAGTGRAGCWARVGAGLAGPGTLQADGRAGRAAGAAGSGSAQAGVRGRAGVGRSGRAGVRSRRRQAGLGAGRAGWPGLCTRCTPLGFQPGFSTRYFS